MRKGLLKLEFLFFIEGSFFLGLIIIPQNLILMHRASDAQIRMNAMMLQTSVEDFATYTEGFYPGGLGDRVNVIRAWAGLPPLPPPMGNYSVAGMHVGPMPFDSLTFLPEWFHNPVTIENDAFFSPGLAPPWSISFAGCVFYEGYDQNGLPVPIGSGAYSYKITWLGEISSICDTLKSGAQ